MEREERPRLRSESRSAYGRGGRFHASVAAGNVDREVSTHRMAIDTEPFGIDFGLLLKKRQTTAGAERARIMSEGRPA